MLIPERISMKLIDAEYDPEDYGRRNVRFIGITGGVGCGKSSVMSYLSNASPQTKKRRSFIFPEVRYLRRSSKRQETMLSMKTVSL